MPQIRIISVPPQGQLARTVSLKKAWMLQNRRHMFAHHVQADFGKRKYRRNKPFRNWADTGRL